MKKIIIIVGILFLLTGCGNKEEQLPNNLEEREGLFLIGKSMERFIYSDELDPMFINDSGVKTSIKEFLPTSNCTYNCIHNYSESVESLYDGGTNIYEYLVEEEKYYLIECNKIDSKFHDGKDILIGKNKDKLVKLC